MPSLVLYALLFMLIPVSGWAHSALSAHTFILQTGWNLISFPVLPEGDRSPTAVFGAMVTPWKREAQDGLKVLFACKRGRQSSQDGANVEALYSQIGRLQVQVESLKKVGTESTGVRRAWIEPAHPELSVVAQCELLGLARSQWVVLNRCPRIGAESSVDAADGRGIHSPPFLRQSADDGGVAAGRISGQPQAGDPIDDRVGIAGD